MDATELSRLAFRALETGDVALSRQVLTDDHVNHMAADEPPACRQHGAPGFLATSAWLRLAFSELSFEELDVLASSDQVFCHVRMRGVHSGPFVVFPPGGKPQVFPATGRRLSVRQFHLFRLADDRLAEHVAVRDDLGMMTQLGFIPPRPATAMRLLGLHLSGGARRSAREAVHRADQAARTAATVPAAAAARQRPPHRRAEHHPSQAGTDGQRSALPSSQLIGRAIAAVREGDEHDRAEGRDRRRRNRRGQCRRGAGQERHRCARL